MTVNMPNPSGAALNARFLDHAPGVEIGAHSHEHAQLIVALHGTARLLDNSGWWLATPRMAVWIPPHRRHRASYTEASSLIDVHFGAQGPDDMPTSCALVMMSSLALELTREAVALSARGDRQTLALVIDLLGRQLTKLPLDTGLFVPEGYDKRVRRVTRYLRERPGASETLAELAARFGASERTLARLFESDTGMTFGKWRERLRIVSAVERLARGLALSRVAAEVGYGSANSFSTAFSRLTGVSPGRYMKHHGRADKAG